MAAVFVLFVVVFIHELGHFLVARWCGVNVSAFSIGFGREIAGFTDKKGTRWKLGWIPLGGYVKFMDDENAASAPSREKLKTMTEAERAGAFQNKPLWARAAVVVAGPVANFLSAIVMFAAVTYASGTVVVPASIKVLPRNPAVDVGLRTGDVVVKVDGTAVTGPEQLKTLIRKAPAKELVFNVLRDDKPLEFKITPMAVDVVEPLKPRPWSLTGWSDWAQSWQHPPAVRFTQVGYLDVRQLEKEAESCGPVRLAVRPHHAAVLAGLQSGDHVKRINGTVIKDFTQLSQVIAKSAGVELAFEVERAGQTLVIKVTPPANERHPDGFGGFESRAIVGIAPNADRSKLPVTYPSLLASIAGGFEQTWLVVSSTLGYIWDVVTQKASAEKIGGLPTIIDVSNQMAQVGLAPVIALIALLSVSIGLLNLFPIPLLDGGHLMFYGIEGARGRPLSDQTQEVCFRVGLSIVMMLMLLALYNDRVRMWTWVIDFARLIGLVPGLC